MIRQRSTAREKGGKAEENAGSGAALTGIPYYPLVAFLTIAVGYLLLFYPAEAARTAALPFIVTPDELLRMWCGGKLEWFSVFDRWPLLALAGVTLGGAWLAGRLGLMLLGVEQRLDGLERVAFAMGVGLNLMSLFALAVGLAGALQQRWVFGGALVGLTVGNLAVWYRYRNGKPSPGLHDQRSASVPASSKGRGAMEDASWYWWLAAAPFVMAIVLGGMLPPAAYDVREYHLQAPKEWFQNGAITFLPHNIYANMPLGSELNSVWGMALVGGKDGWWWGAIGGKTVMACYSLVTAMALSAFGRRLHSLSAGVLAAVIYLSTPWIVSLAGIGYNEGPVAMYALLAIFALWLAGDEDEKDAATRLIALAGFCAGSAVACKYPPVLFLVAPLAIAIVAGIGTPQRAFPTEMASRVGITAVFVAAAAVACGPWFAKNWVLTGNPTYPLLYSAFGGETRTPEKDRQWTQVHSPQPDGKGRRYSVSDVANTIAWMAWETKGASAVMLPLALMAIFVERTRRTVVALALWMLFVFAVWWLFTHRLDRFSVLLLPIGALLAGIGAVAYANPAWRWATLGLIGWSLVSQFPLCTLSVLADNRYFAPLEALRRDEPNMFMGGLRVDAAHKWLNKYVPEGQSALLVGDAEPFDLEVPAIYNTCFDDCEFAKVFEGKSREERLAALQEKRISHVFISWAHLARYRSPGNYGYTSDYVTPQVVHEELVGQQSLMKKVTVDQMIDENGELFEVAKH